jgi:hypothetical protein
VLSTFSSPALNRSCGAVGAAEADDFPLLLRGIGEEVGTGLRLVVDMRGGGRGFLTKSNALSYTSLTSISSTFKSATKPAHLVLGCYPLVEASGFPVEEVGVFLHELPYEEGGMICASLNHVVERGTIANEDCVLHSCPCQRRDEARAPLCGVKRDKPEETAGTAHPL